MARIIYSIHERTNSLLCIVPAVLHTNHVTDYFSQLLQEERAPSELTEHVDFRGCKRFDVAYDSSEPIRDLYAEVIEKKIVAKLIFYASNSLQFGMARMLTGVVESTGVECEVSRNFSVIDTLYQQLEILDEAVEN